MSLISKLGKILGKLFNIRFESGNTPYFDYMNHDLDSTIHRRNDSEALQEDAKKIKEDWKKVIRW